jgi:hypothetical protein
MMSFLKHHLYHLFKAGISVAIVTFIIVADIGESTHQVAIENHFALRAITAFD